MEIAFWMMGLSSLIVAILVRVFPPKGINGLYGYRTPSSMKDEASWKKANDYNAKYLLIIAIGMLIFQILLSSVWGISVKTSLITAFVWFGALIFMISWIEKQLKK
ncbi:MAG: hypothetical protein RLZZ628_2373 [Bacteroidota bacterium]|jgi:uncharacterized membrane protein